MQTADHIIGLPEPAKRESRFNMLTMIVEEPLLTRLYKAMRASISQTEKGSRLHDHVNSEPSLEMASGAYADLAFLRQDVIAPFPVRLGRELTETIRAIRQNPTTWISLISQGKPSSLDKKRRIKAGITVAILFYAITLAAIYASYATLHRQQSSAKDEQQLPITRLQLPPVPVVKTLPVLKQPDSISKNQLTAPAQPPERPKPELVKSEPPSRASDQPSSQPEPQTAIAGAASEPHSPAEAEAPAVPAANHAGSGPGTGDRAGSGSGSGQESAASAKVNYNDVFSVSNVTTRPQILGRPTPGYTEEARRAQVEGTVRLSVVLDASGAVSAIGVVRGLGYGLDEKAIEAARQLRFVPAQKDGQRVSVRVFLEFKFTLL